MVSLCNVHEAFGICIVTHMLAQLLLFKFLKLKHDAILGELLNCDLYSIRLPLTFSSIDVL